MDIDNIILFAQQLLAQALTLKATLEKLNKELGLPIESGPSLPLLLPSPVSSTKKRFDNRNSRDALVAYFKKNQDRGFSSLDLLQNKVSNASSSTLHHQLAYLVKAGVLEKEGRAFRYKRKRLPAVIKTKTKIKTVVKKEFPRIKKEITDARKEKILQLLQGNKTYSTDGLAKQTGGGYYVMQHLIKVLKREGKIKEGMVTKLNSAGHNMTSKRVMLINHEIQQAA